MPVPHWYKEQRERGHPVNAHAVLGMAWVGLVLVVVIVLRSKQ